MRSLLALAALLLALAPSAAGQVPADGSLAVEGLAGASTNGTAALLPFAVLLEVRNLPCLGQGATVTVALAAEATGNATATVAPASMTFVVPVNAGLTGYAHSQGGSVLVARPDASAANATATVTAELTEVQGCPTASVDGFRSSGSANVSFEPLAGAASEPGPAMPAPGLALGAPALAATAAVLRRRA